MTSSAENNNAISLAGVFILSVAVLSLEVTETRVLGFMLWHHFAYLVIGLSIMGLGLGAARVSMKEAKGDDISGIPQFSSIMFGVTAVFSLAIIGRLPINIAQNSWALIGAQFLLYSVLMFVPFYFAGEALGSIFSVGSQNAPRLYFVNLIGSAIGTFVSVPLIKYAGADRTFIFCAALAVLASAFLGSSEKLKKSGLRIALLLVVITPISSHLFPLKSSTSKVLGFAEKTFPNAKKEFSKWDPNARIDVVDVVVEDENAKKALEKFAVIPEDMHLKLITIDGDAATYILKFHKPFREEMFFEKNLHGLAYTFKKNPKAMIIGIGGGVDVMTARHHRARHVDAVEINSRMIEVTKYRFKDFNQRLFFNPEINLIHSEGRSFAASVKNSGYDIIQMTGVDTWTTLASGGYVLSENYLYTLEGFEDFLGNLADNGVFSIIRWYFWPPRETIRLCTTGVQALRNMGAQNPQNHIVVITQGPFASILIKKSSFTPDDILKLEDRIANGSKSLKIIYAPFRKETLEKNAFLYLFDAVENGKEAEFINNYKYDVSPVPDDRPFFFQYYKWGNIINYFKGAQFGLRFQDMWPLGNVVLVISTLASFIMLGLILIIPLKASGAGNRSALLKKLNYFILIGIAFIMTEIALMQKLTLLVGHPTLTLAVTLSSILFAAGIGSFVAGKSPSAKTARIGIIASAIVILFMAYILLPTTVKFLYQPVYLKIILSMLLIFPAGFFMGFAFPLGLKFIGEQGNAGAVPWAFAVNGGASVLGSSVAVIIAMSFGFTVVLTISALLYLISLAFVPVPREG